MSPLFSHFRQPWIEWNQSRFRILTFENLHIRREFMKCFFYFRGLPKIRENMTLNPTNVDFSFFRRFMTLDSVNFTKFLKRTICRTKILKIRRWISKISFSLFFDQNPIKSSAFFWKIHFCRFFWTKIDFPKNLSVFLSIFGRKSIGFFGNRIKNLIVNASLRGRAGKIFSPRVGFEPTTFYELDRCFNHWTTELHDGLLFILVIIIFLNFNDFFGIFSNFFFQKIFQLFSKIFQFFCEFKKIFWDKL